MSLVIPVLNDGRRLAVCLEAIARQTHPAGSLQVIVVDNGSTEDIRAVTDRFPAVTYAREPAPGPAAARNAGVALARGTVLAFTDADCIPEPDWIERGARRLAAEPGCGVVGGRVDMFFADPARPTAAELYDSVTYLQQKRHVEQSRFAATANMLCLKAVFDAVGGFDARFPGASGEDFEWGLRAHDAGWRIVYADEARVAHPAARGLPSLLTKTRRIRDGLRRLEAIRGTRRSAVGEALRALAEPGWLCARMLRDGRLKTLRAKSAVCLVALYVHFAGANWRLPLPLRVGRRLWAVCLEPEPFSEFLALASHRGDFLPNFLITQCYMAWQRAHVPRWDAARSRHVLSFSPGLFARGLRPLIRGGGTVIHRAAPSAAPPAGSADILHVIPSLEIGGSEKLALDIAEGLGHRFRMRVLTGQTVRHAAYEGFDLAVRTTAGELEDELRRRPPDLIHLHYWGPNRWTEDFLAALERALGPEVPVVGNMNNPIAPLLHPRVSHHVFVSRYAADIEPRPTGPVSVIYPGVSPDAWRPAAAPTEAFPTMGMVYRLASCKLDLASIDAIIDIARRVPQARVLIPGGGPYLAKFVDRVTRAGVRANFHFLGWVPFRELPALYDRLDLYLAPVTAESFGVVVPYAMFKGVPVLAYRTGALPEILAGAEWLCSDRDEFVARAEAMLHDRAGARKAAQSLRSGARRFTLNSMLENYEKLYRSLLP